MAEQPAAGHGHRVRLDPWGDVAPAGVWRCLDRARTPGCWWVQPFDDEARAWLGVHATLRPVSGHIEYPSRLMHPPDVVPLF